MPARRSNDQNTGLKSGDIVMSPGDAKDTDIVIMYVSASQFHTEQELILILSLVSSVKPERGRVS